jgi:predicted GNAT family acetyltransferase
MPPRIHRHPDAAAFLERAGSWLLEAEAEHNLLIGLAHQVAAGTTLFQHPIYFATVEEKDAVVGCAFRTPPYKLGVTRMPAGAVPRLVLDVAATYDSIPAVMGDAATAQLFAALWSGRTGTIARAGMRHRIYQLDTVVPPARIPAGKARRATAADAARATEWINAFSEEAGIHTENAAGLAQARIRQRSLFFWETGTAVVSMAAWSGETPNGRRVGYVYTPPACRGHGYATSLVAHISQRILDDGCRFCFLYTDLANPTSNDIYQQIGYRPVCDVIDYNLVAE